jgi:hypothetical protein
MTQTPAATSTAPGETTTVGESTAHNLYLDFVKRAVSGTLTPPRRYDQPIGRTRARRALVKAAGAAVKPLGVELRRPVDVDPVALEEGRIWTDASLTMIGWRRMNNIHRCIEDVLRKNVPGDFIEAGVWRGGATILMRAILAAHGVTDRVVWAADSFAGFPPENAVRVPQDVGMKLDEWGATFEVPVEAVRDNFARFGLLDDQVRFVEGFFSETLPPLRGRQWSIIRLDGDLYESTMDGLENLYADLCPGGWVIVDDYNSIPVVGRAVDEFRQRHGIAEPIERIDWNGAFWQKII